MTNPSPAFKKPKITYASSPPATQKAQKALKRLGFDSTIDFAKFHLLSGTTVTKFFNCQPIQLHSLKKICQTLTLDWQEIVKLCEKKIKALEINARHLSVADLSNADLSNTDLSNTDL